MLECKSSNSTKWNLSTKKTELLTLEIKTVFALDNPPPIFIKTYSSSASQNNALEKRRVPKMGLYGKMCSRERKFFAAGKVEKLLSSLKDHNQTDCAGTALKIFKSRGGGECLMKFSISCWVRPLSIFLKNFSSISLLY